MSTRISSPLIAILLMLAPAAALAAWSSAPHLNDAVCTADGHQWPIGICRDGLGGYLVAWGDNRDSDNLYQVYMQHFDADGNRLWAEDGLRVYDSYGPISRWAMCPDEAGGAYLALCDQYNGPHATVVVQRVAADGSAPWGLAGMVATTGAVDDTQIDVVMVEDGYGGAYVLWSDFRDAATSGADLWMQRVNASGPTWGSIGVNICNRSGDQSHPALAACPGGVVLAWEDSRDYGTNERDLYAQRLDGGGTRQWTFTGEPVSVYAANQMGPVIASDGTGGVFIAWTDSRALATRSTDVYAQHLDGTGTPQGVVNGTSVCWDDAATGILKITPDGLTGAFVVWADYRDEGHDGETLYAQRLDTHAVPLWNTNGEVVCATDGRQGATTFAVGTAGNGDLIVVWPDERYYVRNFYAQRLNSSAARQWANLGLLVTSAPDQQVSPHMVVETDGSAVVTWMDYRPPVDPDIYLQRIDGLGILGLPTSSADAPAAAGVTLRQNVPNPFNPATTIAFDLPVATATYLTVHDAAGRRVRSLLAGETRESGSVIWNGRDDHGRPVPSGVYFYRLEAGAISETRRMVLVK